MVTGAEGLICLLWCFVYGDLLGHRNEDGYMGSCDLFSGLCSVNEQRGLSCIGIKVAFNGFANECSTICFSIWRWSVTSLNGPASFLDLFLLPS